MALAPFEFGFIAGSGKLPDEIISSARENDIPLFSIGIKGITDEVTFSKCTSEMAIGEIGKAIRLLKENNVKRLAIAGYVKRPDFSKIAFDGVGLKLLPKMLLAARVGDDAIMRVILEEFEAQGIEIIGPEAILHSLLAPKGAMGQFAPSASQLEDIEKGAQIIKSTGIFDIGQAVIVCDGVVLAIEAQEGTDEMIKRIITLPEHLRGTQALRRGVILKGAKPQQEKRIDLPTIGITTLENAKSANLAGIAVQSGAALISQRKEMIEFANKNKMFLYGYE